MTNYFCGIFLYFQQHKTVHRVNPLLLSPNFIFPENFTFGLFRVYPYPTGLYTPYADKEPMNIADTTVHISTGSLLFL